MGYTKNQLIEKQVAESPANCPDCKVNYDDKFIEYCEKHTKELEALEFEPPY